MNLNIEMIGYDTMWDGTKKITHAIADEIHRRSRDTVVKLYNIAKGDRNEIMTEIFKPKAIAVGSSALSNSILSSAAGWMEFLKQLKFKNKRAAAFGCYGWSGESVKKLQAMLADGGLDVIDENIKSLWNPDADDFANIPAFVTSLVGKQEEKIKEEQNNNTGKMSNYQCEPCGDTYDSDSGITPETPFESLPDDWHCLVCGVSKDMFKKIEE